MTKPMNRRNFIAKTLGSFAAIGAGTALYAWQIEPRWLQIVKVDMPIRNLPPSLVGKTLMQISDIHVGKRFNHAFLIESFQKVAHLQPDFVVYTGDYISVDDNQVQHQALEEVLSHAVKGKLGTLGILGNHDYGTAWQQDHVANMVTEKLTNHGIQVLRNETVVVKGLQFVGFDDYWGTHFNPEAAFAQYQNALPSIALCHNPDVCDLPIWNDYQSWILSGHTHGGQVKPPFLPAPLLPVKNRRYSAGKILLDGNRTLYINRALGHLWQVRFNVRPEITVFQLQQA